MSILLFDPCASLSGLTEQLRATSSGDVVEIAPANLLRGDPLPARDLTVLVIADEAMALSQAIERAGVSENVARSALRTAIRRALKAASGRPTVIVDTASPDAAHVLAETLACDKRTVHLALAPLNVSESETRDPLIARLKELRGWHKAFQADTLPDENPLDAALAAEYLAAIDTRTRDRNVLDRAIASTAGLVERDRHAVPPPDPHAPRFGLDAFQDIEGYQVWIRNATPQLEREEQAILADLRREAETPRISVIVPVYKPDLELFRSCVESVLQQSYQALELCMCDDHSADPDLTSYLRSLRSDARLRIAVRPENGGISTATNVAAGLATGEFLLFLDQDDELAAGALARVAHAALNHPNVDLIYSDEDKLEPDGRRVEPHFKPDWSPDLLLSQMYMGHLVAVRRVVFEQLGGLRSEFDGSQDYDLVLRVTEKARSVVHIPRIGYHWRKLEGSSALDYRAKPYADDAARRALESALVRRGEAAAVESGMSDGTFRVRRPVHGSPLVTIVIPFRDGASLLQRCLASLRETAGYDHWEALLLDNRSWEPETIALRQQIALDDKCRLLDYDNEFNWSAVNNWAAERSNGDILLFLNSDVEGLTPGWLAALTEHAARPEVGAVGARLLYPDGRVQHAGVILGLGGGVAWHAFCFAPGAAPGYFAQAKVIRNYSAVTGACLAIRRSTFMELGGFDETLAVGFSDVDLCLKARQRGYSVVYTPFAELLHYESATRGIAAFEASETVELFQRWGPLIRSDPYFNPNLDIRRSEFAISTGIEEDDKWHQVLSLAETSSSDSGSR